MGGSCRVSKNLNPDGSSCNRVALSSRERIYLKIIPGKQMLQAEKQAEGKQPTELLPDAEVGFSAATERGEEPRCSKGGCWRCSPSRPLTPRIFLGLYLSLSHQPHFGLHFSSGFRGRPDQSQARRSSGGQSQASSCPPPLPLEGLPSSRARLPSPPPARGRGRAGGRDRRETCEPRPAPVRASAGAGGAPPPAATEPMGSAPRRVRGGGEPLQGPRGWREG